MMGGHIQVLETGEEGSPEWGRAAGAGSRLSTMRRVAECSG